MSSNSSRTAHGRCAECRHELPAREENKNFPFCSTRCREVDLGRWLNEEYTLTVTRDSTERALPSEPETSND